MGEKATWLWSKRIPGRENSACKRPEAGSCLVCPSHGKAPRVTEAQSARGRVEEHAVIEEIGSDGVRRALGTGEVFRFSVSKKRSLWKVLSRKGTWSDNVELATFAETLTLPTD